MIGRVGSIGRIPAELVVSPAQPVSSRRDPLGIAAGTRSHASKDQCLLTKKASGVPDLLPPGSFTSPAWARKRSMSRERSHPSPTHSAMLVPPYCHAVATLLPPYCRANAALLPPYCHIPDTLLPRCCHTPDTLLQRSCRLTAALLQRSFLPPYCHATATLLPCSCHLLPPDDSAPPFYILLLLLFFKTLRSF